MKVGISNPMVVAVAVTAISLVGMSLPTSAQQQPQQDQQRPEDQKQQKAQQQQQEQRRGLSGISCVSQWVHDQSVRRNLSSNWIAS
jgi:hypothetical protein